MRQIPATSPPSMVKYPLRASNPRPMYPYPVWRRAPFIGLLLIVLVIAYAPATTLGTSTLRLTALFTPSIVKHIYVQASSISLHRQGYLNDTGWTTISQTFPIIDIVAPSSQSAAQTISSATVHSGRYDQVRIFFANSTAVIGGSSESMAPPAPIFLNNTLLVSPNGTTDLQIIVAFDYTALLAATPSLNLVLVRTS